jgi:LPXTG-motif cell wall-anchored protein
MKLRTRRVLARAGAGGLALFASGAMIAVGGAAHADAGADLELTVSSGSVAIGEPLAKHRATSLNKGPGDAVGWQFEYDLSGLDDSVVTVGDRLHLGCELAGEKIRCSTVGLAQGHSLAQPTPFTLTKVPGKHGSAGFYTVTAVSETDPDQTNNSAKVEVEVPAIGVDLAVYAEDVHQVTEEGEFTDRPVPPGGRTLTFGVVGNFGDTIARGIKVRVTLPQYLTFDEVEPGCAYSAGNRTVTCDYDQITLVPADQDTDDSDDVISAVGIVFPVKVAEDAPGPVVARGGEMFSSALAVEDGVDPASVARSRSAGLPEGATGMSAKQLDDADPADNTDTFRAHIGAPAGDGGGGGVGGGLPVTGVQAGLIGGVGAGVVLLGGALFLLARRRRVVLVNPGDEKTVS